MVALFSLTLSAASSALADPGWIVTRVINDIGADGEPRTGVIAFANGKQHETRWFNVRTIDGKAWDEPAPYVIYLGAHCGPCDAQDPLVHMYFPQQDRDLDLSRWAPGTAYRPKLVEGQWKLAAIAETHVVHGHCFDDQTVVAAVFTRYLENSDGIDVTLVRSDGINPHLEQDRSGSFAWPGMEAIVDRCALVPEAPTVQLPS